MYKNHKNLTENTTYVCENDMGGFYLSIPLSISTMGEPNKAEA
jgi:hypothetical protein